MRRPFKAVAMFGNASGALLGLPFKRPLWSAAVVAIGAVAAAAFWYWESIASTYTSVETSVVSVMGLTLVPVGAWLLALGFSVAKKRDWLFAINVWAGTAAFVVALAGVLSYVAPPEGALGFFGEFGTLGGSFGASVTGDASAVGILTIPTAAIVAMLLTFPALSMDLAGLLGRGLVIMYVGAAIGLRALVGTFGRMYRFDNRPQVQTEACPIGHGTVSQPEEGSRERPGVEPGRSRLENDPRPAMGEATAPLALVEAPAAEPEIESPPFPELNGHTEPEDEVSLFDGVGSIAVTNEGDAKVNRFWNKPAENGANGHESPPTEEDTVVEAPVAPETSKGPWKRPSQDLLADAVEGGITEEEMSETSATIQRTLAEYGVEVESGEMRPGPAVTMYGLVPGWVRRYKQAKALDEDGVPRLDQAGKPLMTRVESKTRVKVDSILSREKDLALALRTPSIRIETPVMGKSMVGIEVPNPEPALVTLGHVMRGAEFGKLRKRAKLPIAVGKGSGGETVVLDLAKMPHLLVAGATGSGKSVFINTVVSSLLMERDPSEMRLLLVDPKRVELTPYNGVPHLLTPVVVETDKVVGLLKGLIQEMLNRYRRMEEIGVRNIEGFNEKVSDRMPYIVVAVDELADLMMTSAFDVEHSLVRLAQLGRATGIHLVVATQRPSVDVVTGLIKANFPSRVSFGVTSQIDSRTILDTAGAEKLLGRGDMLYQSQDAARPERVQGVFISDSEIESLVRFWQTTPRREIADIPLKLVRESDVEDRSDKIPDPEGPDKLIDKAVELASSFNKLSTSLLQRRLRIGYPRAARLMDQLEEAGVVGPGDGSKSRDVIISSTA